MTNELKKINKLHITSKLDIRRKIHRFYHENIHNTHFEIDPEYGQFKPKQDCNTLFRLI